MGQEEPHHLTRKDEKMRDELRIPVCGEAVTVGAIRT